MSSAADQNRTALRRELEFSGTEMAPCSACRKSKPRQGVPRPKCIVGAKSGRCSECVRKGYSKCDVTLSTPEWVRFRDLRNRLKKELEEADEVEVSLLHEQQDILQKILRHKAKKIRIRKQLRLAGEKTDSAMSRELEELEAVDAIEDCSDLTPEEGIAVSEVVGGTPWEMSPGDWIGLCDPSFPLEGLASFPADAGPSTAGEPSST